MCILLLGCELFHCLFDFWKLQYQASGVKGPRNVQVSFSLVSGSLIIGFGVFSMEMIISSVLRVGKMTTLLDLKSLVFPLLDIIVCHTLFENPTQVVLIPIVYDRLHVHFFSWLYSSPYLLPSHGNYFLLTHVFVCPSLLLLAISGTS